MSDFIRHNRVVLSWVAVIVGAWMFGVLLLLAIGPVIHL